MIPMHQVVQEQLAAVVKVVPVVKMVPLPLEVIRVVKVTPVPVVKATLVVQPLLQVQFQLEATPGLKGQGNLILKK